MQAIDDMRPSRLPLAYSRDERPLDFYSPPKVPALLVKASVSAKSLNVKIRSKRTGRYTFSLDGRVADFAPAIPLPEAPTGLNALLSTLLGWLGNQPWAMRSLDKMGKRALEKMNL